MRILQINKFFYHRGGAEAVFFDTITGLRARGHEVIEFSTRDSRNLPSDFSEYFINSGDETVSLFKHPLLFYRHFFSNKEVEQNLQALILATEPEVVHLHNLDRHLFMRVIKIVKRNHLSIVLTLSDTRPLCPTRRVGSTLSENIIRILVSGYFWWKQIWKSIDCFICSSDFLLNKLAELKIPKDKLILNRLPFVLVATYPPLGDKIVYLGRFHEEKGIKLYLAALPWLRAYEAIVAGSGPENDWVENFIKQYSLTNVLKTGWIEKERWGKIMSQAKVVVVPAVLFESCPPLILEALSFGRLVVAANRGGIPELIRDGETGFLVSPDNVEALAVGIKRAMSTGAEAADKIISAGRKLIEINHCPEKYFTQLETIYLSAIKKPLI